MITLRNRLSVRTRLTLISAFVAVAVLSIGGLLFYANLGTTLDQALNDELRVRALDVREEVEQGGAVVNEGELRAELLDAHGVVIEPDDMGSFLDRAETATARTKEIVVEHSGGTAGVRVLAIPTVQTDGRPAVIAVAGSTHTIERAQRHVAVALLLVGPAIVAFTILAAWLLAGAALRPVRTMSRRAQDLSAHHPDASLPVPPGHDEVAELGRTLNEMLARIARTIAHERAFIDDASHELRAPLAVMRGELELALMEANERGDAPEIQRALTSAIEEADDLTALSERLLVLARADAGDLAQRREPVAILERARALADQLDRPSLVIDVVGDSGEGDSMEGDDVEGGTVAVDGDPVAIDQLLTNLLANAVRWAERRVRVSVHVPDGDGIVVLAVEDDGPGFDPAFLPYALDRFRRGDPARALRERWGSGPRHRRGDRRPTGRRRRGRQRLGARRRIDRGPPPCDGGRATHGPTAGFTELLASVVHDADVDDNDNSDVDDNDNTDGGDHPFDEQAISMDPPLPRVLVVEDDLKLAFVIQRALSRQELDVRIAVTGDAALRAMRELRPEVAVVDIMIPHPDGLEVCRQIRRDGWTGPILVISGRSSPQDQSRALDAGADSFLAKPFRLTHLHTEVAAMLGAPLWA